MKNAYDLTTTNEAPCYVIPLWRRNQWRLKGSTLLCGSDHPARKQFPTHPRSMSAWHDENTAVPEALLAYSVWIENGKTGKRTHTRVRAHAHTHTHTHNTHTPQHAHTQNCTQACAHAYAHIVIVIIMNNFFKRTCRPLQVNYQTPTKPFHIICLLTGQVSFNMLSLWHITTRHKRRKKTKHTNKKNKRAFFNDEKLTSFMRVTCSL